MCRSIKPLFNFEPPAADDEIKAAVLQFVKKVYGFQKIPKTNEFAIENSVNEINAIIDKLFNELKTKTKPRNREAEEKLAREKSRKRFAKS